MQKNGWRSVIPIVSSPKFWESVIESVAIQKTYLKGPVLLCNALESVVKEIVFSPPPKIPSRIKRLKEKTITMAQFFFCNCGKNVETLDIYVCYCRKRRKKPLKLLLRSKRTRHERTTSRQQNSFCEYQGANSKI